MSKEPQVTDEDEDPLDGLRAHLEEVVAERELPGPESQTFAQHGLVLMDRIDRTLRELREQLRYADETLLLASLGGNVNPIRLTVINNHHQSFGVQVDRVGAEVRLVVTHRGQPGMTDIPRGQIYQEDL